MTLRRIKRDIERLGLFDPTIIYGYYPARSFENNLYLFDEKKRAILVTSKWES